MGVWVFLSSPDPIVFCWCFEIFFICNFAYREIVLFLFSPSDYRSRLLQYVQLYKTRTSTPQGVNFHLFGDFSFEQVAEGKQEEIQQKGLAEKKELQHKIDEMEEREQELQAKIEALQADNDFTNERLTALQG